MRALADRLTAAKDAGEIVGIVYKGGSQPGAYREILPLSLNAEYVRARCYTSQEVKTFRLDRIELRDRPITVADQQIIWKQEYQTANRVGSIPQLHAHYAFYLEALGWHVKREGDELTLHTYFKNGKVRKGAVITMAYRPSTERHYLGPHGLEVERTPATRPWYLDGKTFSNADRALEQFLAGAERLAPKKGEHIERPPLLDDGPQSPAPPAATSIAVALTEPQLPGAPKRSWWRRLLGFGR